MNQFLNTAVVNRECIIIIVVIVVTFQRVFPRASTLRVRSSTPVCPLSSAASSPMALSLPSFGIRTEELCSSPQTSGKPTSAKQVKVKDIVMVAYMSMCSGLSTRGLLEYGRCRDVIRECTNASCHHTVTTSRQPLNYSWAVSVICLTITFFVLLSVSFLETANSFSPLAGNGPSLLWTLFLM